MRLLTVRKLQYVGNLAEQTQEAFERSAIRMGEEWSFVRAPLARDFPQGALRELELKIATT